MPLSAACDNPYHLFCCLFCFTLSHHVLLSFPRVIITPTIPIGISSSAISLSVCPIHPSSLPRSHQLELRCCLLFYASANKQLCAECFRRMKHARISLTLPRLSTEHWNRSALTIGAVMRWAVCSPRRHDLALPGSVSPQYKANGWPKTSQPVLTNLTLRIRPTADPTRCTALHKHMPASLEFSTEPQCTSAVQPNPAVFG